MELVICQNCAQIIRGRSKFCNGCGTTISRHSPTLVPGFDTQAPAMVLDRMADPLILERTVNRVIYGNGNGNGNGHGDFLYESNDYDMPAPESDDARYDDIAPDHAKNETFNVTPGMAAALGASAATAGFAAGMAAANKMNEPPDFSTMPLARSAQNDEFSPAMPDSDENSPTGGESRTGGESQATDPYFTLPSKDQPESQVPDSMQPSNSGMSDSDDFFGDAPGPASSGSADTASSDTKTAPAAQDDDSDDFFGEPKPSSGTGSGASESGDSGDSGEPSDFFGAPDANSPDSEDFIGQEKDDFFEESTADPSGARDKNHDSPSEDSLDEPATPPAAAADPAAFDASTPLAPVIEPPKQAPSMDFFAATGGGFFEQGRSSPPSQPVPQGGDMFSVPPQQGVSAVLPATMAGTQASIIQSAIAAAMNAQKAEATESSDAVSMDTSEAPKARSGTKKKKKPELAEEGSAGPKKKKLVVGDEDDGEDSKPPASKKSKNGAPSSTSSGKAKGKSGKAIASKKEAPKSFEIMGFSIPQKMLASGAVVVICVVFPVIVLLSQVASIVSGISGALGGGGAASSGAGDLSGRWKIAFRGTDQSVNMGELQLSQRGSHFDGIGSDMKAPFQIAGEVKDNVMTFNKQYILNGQPAGKPITYKGAVDNVSQNPPPGEPFKHVSGVWQFQKGEGFSWRRKVVTYSGQWEMVQISLGEAAPAAGSTGQGSGTVVSKPLNDLSRNDPKKAHEFFMKIALGLLGLGGVLVFASLKFFGPSGMLNIWAKKEYIPSQFKSQHFKLVGEMGKPLKKGGMPIGSRVEWGIHQFWMPKALAMPPDLREQNPHLLIIGQGSKGKSRLMAGIIAHDIESADRAVVVVDSDGALVDMIMNWIGAHPKGREIAERVIMIDPTHNGENLCYNPLEFPDDGDLQNAASAVVFGFKAIYTEPPGSQSQWNQQTANILRNAAVLLMANGKTLTDLPVLLSDNDFRDILLEKVERMKGDKTEYTTLIENWTNYKRLARTDQWINWIEPILNRVQPMLSDPRIRPILTQPKGGLNLKDVILQKKILFVKIPHGQLDQNGNLLGALILTGLKQAALSLSVRNKDKVRPCSLYLDEFDNFIEKETFDAITTETRKFQIGLCSCVKTLQGLPEDFRNQIIANIGCMAVFALTKKDGDMLGPQMFRVDGRKVKHQTISNVFNRVNTSPQFELISDEEKLNIDRVVAQEERTFFFYRVGSVAGVFNVKSPEFKDVAEKDVNEELVELMYENRLVRREAGDEEDEDDDDDDD